MFFVISDSELMVDGLLCDWASCISNKKVPLMNTKDMFNVVWRLYNSIPAISWSQFFNDQNECILI